MLTKALRKTQKNGFTLIELLVVISIIALLLSILMPSLQKARTLAKQAVCASNLHQISIASLTYEIDNERLPMHYTENGGNAVPEGEGEPLKSWPDMVANVYSLDTRPLWVPYIPDLKFFNCPMVKSVDYNIERAPLNCARVYAGYQFVMGYMRNRTTDKQWGNRWTKTTQKWTYEGKRFNVIAFDRLYYSLSFGHYRVNHGQNSGLSRVYSDYEKSRSTGWIGSLYSQYWMTGGDDLRLKMTSSYAFTDGSVQKLRGDDDQIVKVSTPSDQDTHAGSLLMPSN